MVMYYPHYLDLENSLVTDDGLLPLNHLTRDPMVSNFLSMILFQL